MNQRHYLTCLAAYLTGWVIAQSIFNRVWRHVLNDQTSQERKAFIEEMADIVADKLESRGKLGERVGTRILADKIFELLPGTTTSHDMDKIAGVESMREAVQEAFVWLEL